jgi:hypothetical protein
MDGNVFDKYETKEEPIEEVEDELKCRHLGRIITMPVKHPGNKPEDKHSHMASVCDECSEILGYAANFCPTCGPLP